MDVITVRRMSVIVPELDGAAFIFCLIIIVL